MIQTLSLSHYLVLAAILFAISVVGIFLNRRNIIVLLMAIELMLLAVNLNTSSATSPGRYSCSSSSPWRPPNRRSASRSWSSCSATSTRSTLRRWIR